MTAGRSTLGMGGKWGTVLVALAAAGAVFAPTAQRLSAQSRPEGVWNIRSQDMTDRATGGVRVVLLQVRDESGTLAGYITSINNRFMPVEEFSYRGATMRVVFGSYTYTLRVRGDDLTGTVVSPLGTQQVEGFRQYNTLMYAGDQGADFHTQRSGVIGLASGEMPPQGEPDPAAWVRSRIASVEDLALLAGNRVRVPVQFTNARDFERQLLDVAGRRANIQAVWVGERLRLESIEPAAP